jgi:hypothetical protein
MLLLLLFVVSCRPLSPPAPAPTEPVSASSDTAAPALMKIAAPLRQVKQRMQEDGLTAGNVAAHHADTYTTPLVRVDAQGNIHAVLLVSVIDEHVLALLAEHQVRIDILHEKLHQVQAWIPFDRLEDVATLPFVRYIRPPSYATLR